MIIYICFQIECNSSSDHNNIKCTILLGRDSSVITIGSRWHLAHVADTPTWPLVWAVELVTLLTTNFN